MSGLLVAVGSGSGVSLATAEEQASVAELRVTPDYHSVDVSWRYGGSSRTFGFSVQYCELQAWGANRCKSKVRQRTDIQASAHI